MSILDKAKIGNSVQINLELSKDRLNKDIVDAINNKEQEFEKFSDTEIKTNFQNYILFPNLKLI